MSELLLGFIVGIAATVYAARYYRSRDGKVADFVRRIIGIPKEQDNGTT
jgi:hypothetical protein